MPWHKDFPTSPEPNPDSVVTAHGAKYRFTVLTDGMIRYEWSPDGQFEDRASTFIINRNLPTPHFRANDHGDGGLEIITKRFHLTYDKTAFSSSGFTAQVLGDFSSWKSRWRYGKPAASLGGTARTLDESDGRVALDSGVISRFGFASIDDSKSMLFDGDGWVCARKHGDRIDGYLFAYGYDYRTAIRDLYTVSGPTPLLPRWALGNWWSRYHAYSAGEYLALMDRFKAENIPFSVAVIDMDWHLVRDERVQGQGVSGWTGYTWNKRLFPDPQDFMSEVHKRQLKLTLNDHPADGVQSFEDAYKNMAKALNHDTSNNDPIEFNATDPKFLGAFFNILRRPIEQQGCDFWWLDWQQGRFSRVPGLDPLWMLNHYSFLDNAWGDRRPLNLSRYAGPGSHRYPIGFSGDTRVSWESLQFQPEFTNTASNIGYGWWSHDIGGHQFGRKDDELSTRWVQLGVFSPIVRLHSTRSMWMGKEPWNFDWEYQQIQTTFLRFRHRMLPYLYTMNVRASQGEPLCQPMYWEHPTRVEAYKVPNQYYFGSEMIVAPITLPRHIRTRLARVRGWLPPGTYVDIFTETAYSGDRYIWFNRPMEGYPVLARQGAIIPLTATNTPGFGCANVDAFEVLIAVGANGSFRLIEDDDGNVENLRGRETLITFSQAEGTLCINRTDDVPGLPSNRSWKLRFLACTLPSALHCIVNGAEERILAHPTGKGFSVELNDIAATSSITLSLGKEPHLIRQDARSQVFPILKAAQIDYSLKQEIWDALDPSRGRVGHIMRIHALPMEREILDALLEILLAESTS